MWHRDETVKVRHDGLSQIFEDARNSGESYKTS